MENKLLGTVPAEIRDRQLARDEQTLKSKKATLLEKERIRHQMHEAVR